MRVIDEVILHCTDTPMSFECTIDDIRDWHLARGFYDVGYHAYIDRNGFVWYGRDLDRAGAHTKGRNATTIGVCFEGGMDAGWEPTPEQVEAYMHYEEELFNEFGKLPVNPHNKYSDKTCPNFSIDILKS